MPESVDEGETLHHRRLRRRRRSDPQDSSTVQYHLPHGILVGIDLMTCLSQLESISDFAQQMNLQTRFVSSSSDLSRTQ
jgi:hypothetical protein